MLIKDRITLGTIAGLAGTVPQVLISLISFKIGYAEYFSYQLSAGVHLTKPLTMTPMGIIMGGLIWELTGAILGILILFFIIKTGTDFWWLKGILVANFLMYTVIYGFGFEMGIANVLPEDIGTNFTEMVGNTLFGFTAAFLVARWQTKQQNTPGS